MSDLSYSDYFGIPASQPGQPTLEVAMEYPLQGHWTEEDFFKLDLARGYELVDGRLELLMEIVSPGKDSRKRDLVDKRSEYAEAGIPEYWIVDPEQRTINVLTLDGAGYGVA
jgi:putative restriction endonuclease